MAETRIKNLKISETVKIVSSLPDGSVLFSVEGVNGVLFKITDSYENGIVSFNDISGLPVLTVRDDIVQVNTDLNIDGILKLSGVSIYDLINKNESVIQERIITNSDITNGYMDLHNKVKDVVSVNIVGGTSQFGSTDPGDSGYIPDFHINNVFEPSRLVWRETWGLLRKFKLNDIITTGDKLVIIYNINKD